MKRYWYGGPFFLLTMSSIVMAISMLSFHQKASLDYSFFTPSFTEAPFTQTFDVALSVEFTVFRPHVNLTFSKFSAPASHLEESAAKNATYLPGWLPSASPHSAMSTPSALACKDCGVREYSSPESGSTVS